MVSDELLEAGVGGVQRGQTENPAESFMPVLKLSPRMTV
jgi:hypothetical protein